MPYTRSQRLTLFLVPRLAAPLIALLGRTLRYRDIYPSHFDAAASDPPRGDTIPPPVVFAFWHCALLACAHRFRNKRIAILISQSFDGELIARTVERLGFIAIRGSSSRGASTALRQMADAYASGHRCAFTADGPRGPAFIAKPGPAHLAALAGATWVGAFHALPLRAWRLRTWDQFLIPKPFSTVLMTWPPHATPDLPAIQHALDTAVAMTTQAQALTPRP